MNNLPVKAKKVLKEVKIQVIPLKRAIIAYLCNKTTHPSAQTLQC